MAETGDRLERQVYALVVENGYQNHDRFPVLDADWPTISAALPHFLTGPNDRLQTVCEALQFFLEFTGRWDEPESKAVELRDFLKAGWAAYQAGWMHHQRGQSAEVLACADRAEAHWREARAGAHELASTLGLRGLGHRLSEEL